MTKQELAESRLWAEMDEIKKNMRDAEDCLNSLTNHINWHDYCLLDDDMIQHVKGLMEQQQGLARYIYEYYILECEKFEKNCDRIFFRKSFIRKNLMSPGHYS